MKAFIWESCSFSVLKSAKKKKDTAWILVNKEREEQR